MHSNDQSSDRNAEFNLDDHDFGRETHFIGDSMTSTSIMALWDAMERGFAEIKAEIDHGLNHTADAPVEGCDACGVRREA